MFIQSATELLIFPLPATIVHSPGLPVSISKSSHKATLGKHNAKIALADQNDFLKEIGRKRCNLLLYFLIYTTNNVHFANLSISINYVLFLMPFLRNN